MPGSMTTNGTEELAKILNMCATEAGNIASQALYEGARVVADAYKENAQSIIATRRRHNEPGGRMPTQEEKAAVVNGIGVARFNKEGGAEVNTMIGVAEGYAYTNGRKKAIKLLARSINSGTNFMKRQPVFRRASSQSRGRAQDAMVAKADELINQIAK